VAPPSSEDWGAISADINALRRRSTHSQFARLRRQTRPLTLRSSQLPGPATQTQATGCKSRDNQEKRRWFRYSGLVQRDIQCHSSEIVAYVAIGMKKSTVVGLKRVKVALHSAVVVDDPTAVFPL